MRNQRITTYHCTKALYTGPLAATIPWLVAFGVPIGAAIAGSDWTRFPTIPFAALTVLLAMWAQRTYCLLGGLLLRGRKTTLAEFDGRTLQLHLEGDSKIDIRELEEFTVSFWLWLALSWLRISFKRHDGSQVTIRSNIAHPRLLWLLKLVEREVKRLQPSKDLYNL